MSVPENTSYISILAKGNLGAVYEKKSNGSFRLISDKYLDGDEWIADVRDVKKVIIKIQPFVDSDKNRVYLETTFETGNIVPEVYALGENVFVKTPAKIF